MSTAGENLKNKLHNDSTIPDTVERLKVLSMGSVYPYAPELSKLIREEEDKETEWLMVIKAYLSLDSSIRFTERYKKRKLFKSALKNSWGINDKHELIDQMNYLLDGTNSQYANIQLSIYCELIHKNLEITSKNIKKTETFNKIYGYEGKSEDGYEQIVNYLMGALEIIDLNSHNLLTKSWVRGFDLSRVVHLVKMGYGTGLISENEAWTIIDNLYEEFQNFDTYYEFFASNELGNLLFEYDRELDSRRNLENRINALVPILLDIHTPFRYLQISEDNPEAPAIIYRKIFNIEEIKKV
ncbi:DUF1266 domain-containing protein [Clostridium sp. LIBA-8841]|uniref:DUF1266 domain-containing protein n=1 Tax=Clostridium sp. LIBA-8841 TaxID=2987530 RepID=UPI002AC43618|nr:DUF1266 domain-containing protein [Clostridium sp. LIBA-8841]MDZ5253710.1 DUF1266 domain-containing protein [Clostridium sp. LIBA-8841]